MLFRSGQDLALEGLRTGADSPGFGERLRRGQTLRQRMMLLVLVSFLPAMALSSAVVVLVTQRLTAAHDARQADALGELTAALDRWLETAMRLAEATAGTPGPPAQVRAVAERAQLVAELVGSRIVLRDAAGNAMGPEDGRLPASALAMARAAAGPVLVDAMTYGPNRLPMPHVLAAMPEGGFVDVALRPSRLRTLVAVGHVLAPTLTLLSNADGTVLASSDAVWERKALPEAAKRVLAGPGGQAVSDALPDGGAHLLFYAHPRLAPRWSVSVWVPQERVGGMWRAPLLVWLAAITVSLAVCVALAAVQARRLLRPLEALTRNARVTATGVEMPLLAVPASSVREFEALRVGVARAAMALRQRAERERRAVREARDRQVLLASVINASADGIVVTDRAGRRVLANAAAERLLGGPGAARASLAALDAQVLNSGELRSTEVEWPEEAGARRLWLIKSPWRDAGGAALGVVTLLRDVTAQRADAARLHALQAEQVEASLLSAIGVMAAGLAHDLNQPLAAASNFLGAAAQLLEPGAAARGAVCDAGGQVLRAAEIVRAFRAFLSEGRIAPREVAVGSLLADAAAVARADGSLGAARLEIAPVDAALHVWADPTQMRQVLLNLIRNAAAAVQEAGAGVIRLSAGLEEARVALCVADDGPGIAPVVRARLFEPFVSTRRGGLGFGLAICRALVEAHGGRLSAGRDAALGGACFTITLDAAGPSPAEEA